MYKRICQICVKNVKEYFVAQWFILLSTYILVLMINFSQWKFPFTLYKIFKNIGQFQHFYPMMTSRWRIMSIKVNTLDCLAIICYCTKFSSNQSNRTKVIKVWWIPSPPPPSGDQLAKKSPCKIGLTHPGIICSFSFLIYTESHLC